MCFLEPAYSWFLFLIQSIDLYAFSDELREVICLLGYYRKGFAISCMFVRWCSILLDCWHFLFFSWINSEGWLSCCNGHAIFFPRLLGLSVICLSFRSLPLTSAPENSLQCWVGWLSCIALICVSLEIPLFLCQFGKIALQSTAFFVHGNSWAWNISFHAVLDFVVADEKSGNSDISVFICKLMFFSCCF